MKISVCVPSSRPDTVAATIRSVLRQSWEDWELLVVGQGELADERARATREVVSGFAASDRRVRYVHIQERGATRARNAGVAAAKGDVIAFTDDDCEARENWLAVIADSFVQAPEVGLVGGAAQAPPKERRGVAVCPTVMPAEVLYDPVTMDYTPPPGWEWISCNVAIRRDVIAAIGPWDEHLGPGTVFPVADDTDYLLRAEALGVKMLTTPRMVVTHTHGYRYNREVFKHLRNYSYGNGGLAAKLTLMGDERGEAWREGTKRERLRRHLWPFRPDRFARSMAGWVLFSRAYRRCLSEYYVVDNLLRPVAREGMPTLAAAG